MAKTNMLSVGYLGHVHVQMHQEITELQLQ
jgi:hypothetical protein